MKYLILQKASKKDIHNLGYLVTKNILSMDAKDYKTRILELEPEDELYFVSERGNYIGKGTVVSEFTTDVDFGKGNEGYARNIAVKITTNFQETDKFILTDEFLFQLNEHNNQPKLQYVNKLRDSDISVIEGE